MKVYKVDVYGEGTGVKEIEDSLEAFYEEIGCDIVEIPTRYIDGVEFDIICDEEGMLKSNVKVSALDGEFKPMLVGNLLFAHLDDEGNMVGISEEDAELIASHIMRVVMRDGSENDVVYGCELYPPEEDEE